MEPKKGDQRGTEAAGGINSQTGNLGKRTEAALLVHVCSKLIRKLPFWNRWDVLYLARRVCILERMQTELRIH